MSDRAEKKRWLALAVVAAGGAATVAAILTTGSRAELTGATAEERIACICRLADEKPRGAEAVIAAAATGESDPAVRRAAVVALGRFLPGCRAAALAATRDADPSVRAAAAGTLGLFADHAAAARLGEMIQDGKDEPAVRAAAAAALDGNRCPQATVLLVEAVESHPVDDVRNHAAVALIRNFGLIQIKPNPQAVDEYRRHNPRYWLDMIETVKLLPATKEAFEKLRRPLVLHPQNVIPRPDEH